MWRMMGGRTVRSLLMVSLLVCSSFLAGCTGALEFTVDPSAELNAFPLLIQEGETVTFDARDSDPIEGLIAEYRWDFGDGQTTETTTGFTSHRYTTFGIFTAELTVVNDQGGEDTATKSINVNGAPTLNITYPDSIRSGDSVYLDASNSIDPEGDELRFEWDLNWGEDSDGDGDMRNDIDATESTVLLPTNRSGIIQGSLTATDSADATVKQLFTLEIKSRRYEVTWETMEIEYSWDEYLDQGQQWEGNITPGEDGRISSFLGVLELQQDLIAPQDNFTLSILIVDDGYEKTEQTGDGNFTSNESATATLSADNINSAGEAGVYDSDSEEALLHQLLSSSGNQSGQGTWIWTVYAQQADPEPLFEGAPDPDPGNDWTLTVTVTLLIPKLTEIAYE
ncbi:MAG: PKD domain-containing protein [Euryarchaeota archaeon]|nr:PKD domain-containing protein [Euryarchaeota archaeon]MBT7263500.1 PKD domain-containing protein [Euryarchaeota archaeon]MBT7638707.1 PKD domain-containing protein [Euryarchaeota archaeon]